MTYRYLTTTLVILAVFTTTAGEAWAQSKVYRPSGTAFIKPKVGLSNYLGDNEKSPINFNGDAFDVATPFGLAAEVGYQFSVSFSTSFAIAYGDYPVITQFPPPNTRPNDAVADDPSSRTSIQVFGRMTAGEAEQRAAPYFNFGLVASFGTATQIDHPSYTAEESAVGFGPLLGVGVDIAMNARTSFFVELNSGFHFGDDQLDANADNGLGPTDILSGLGLGFKVNFKPAITPVGVQHLTCPTGNVMLGVDADFSAETNPAATLPVAMTWAFGDGTTASGATATHAFTTDGAHTVTFTAENEAGPASADCVVTVIEPAEIVTITASKPTVSICDENPSVTFSANTRGSVPLTYSWDFGDGNTSSEAEPSHAYAEPGTYEVTLTLTNVGGTATQSMEMEVTEEGCFDCNISSMNSVYFDRNSSVLNEEARPLLAENLEILQNCEFAVRVEGHASRDERRPQQLSEDRAHAVAQYYTDNGIAEDRLMVQGMGASEQTGKKSGASQFRRVDTIPDDQ